MFVFTGTKIYVPNLVILKQTKAITRPFLITDIPEIQTM